VTHYIDRKRLLREWGLTRATVDRIFERLPVLSLPGERKMYVRAEDVESYLAHHTYDGRTAVRPR
jgi:hypothetical protein